MRSLILALILFLSPTSFATTVTQSIFDGQITAGKAYSLSTVSLAVADAGTYEVLVQVGVKPLKVGFILGTGGASRAYLFEGTTFSAAGTGLTPTNLLRPSTNTPLSTFTHTPTTTGDGTQLGVTLIPGDTKKGEFGGSREGGTGFILSPSTSYMIRVTNVSGGAVDILISLLFYE